MSDHNLFYYPYATGAPTFVTGNSGISTSTGGGYSSQSISNWSAATNAQDNYVYAASWSAGYDAAGVPISSFSDNHHAWGSSSNSGSSYWFTRWTPQGGVTTSASDSSAASNSSSYNTNPGAAEIGSPSVPAVGTAVGLDEGVVACGGLDEGVVACGGPLPLAAAVAGAAAPEPPPASKGFWGHAGDFASGIWHSGKEAVGGIKDLAVGGFYLSSLGSLVNPDQSRQTAETVVTVASTVWNNPGVIWDAIADPYKTAWKEGRPGEAIGRGVTEVFIGVVGAKGVNYLVKPAKGSKLGSVATKADDVAKVANFPWMFWGNLPKMTVNGKTYAQIGGRLYTQHAVDRMLPSGLGAPAGAGPSGAGRSIAPAFVEEVIRNGAAQRGQIVNGAQRTIHTSGTVQIITEDGGRIVITVNNITP